MKKGNFLVAELGGLPMIDDEVDCSVLATLACAVRQRLDGKKRPLADYIQPDLARACYRQASRQPATELESIAFSDEDMSKIHRTCQDVIATVPVWQTFFSVPLCWRCLVVDNSSSSNPLVPQHIYLGRNGLASPMLAENIIHELSHTWIGMLAEITPLAECSEPVHILPSGTPCKDISQVMYALTFAITAVRYYRAMEFLADNTTDNTQRLTYLESYVDGCLKIVESNGKLTSDGMLIAKSCRSFLQLEVN